MEKNEFEEEIHILKTIHSDVSELKSMILDSPASAVKVDLVFLVFKGAELYLLLKAFIDSGATPHEHYKSLFEKVVPYISNKTQKGFSPASFTKFSDKVDPEAKETVKRFLQKMIRNVDSYD